MCVIELCDSTLDQRGSHDLRAHVMNHNAGSMRTVNFSWVCELFKKKKQHCKGSVLNMMLRWCVIDLSVCVIDLSVYVIELSVFYIPQCVCYRP